MSKAPLTQRISGASRRGTLALDSEAAASDRFLPQSDYSTCAQDCMQNAWQSSQCTAKNPFPCFCEDPDAGQQALNCIQVESRLGCDDEANDAENFSQDMAHCKPLDPPAETSTGSSVTPSHSPSPTFETTSLSTQAPQRTAPTTRATTSVMTSPSSPNTQTIGANSVSERPIGSVTTDNEQIPATKILTFMTGSAPPTFSLANSSTSSTTATPSGSSETSPPPSSVSLASGALGNSAEPTASSQAPMTLQTQESHSPSKLLISLCAALSSIILVIIGLILVCKRRRRHRRLHAPSTTTLQSDPMEKGGDDERSGEEHNPIAAEEARFRPRGDIFPSSSEPTLTFQHRRASNLYKPTMVISSVAEISPPDAHSPMSPTLEIYCGPYESEADSPALMIVPGAAVEDALDLPTQDTVEEGEELGVGGHDRHARSPPLRETVNSPLAISAQGHPTTIPATTAICPPPSLPPFNHYHDLEKDVIPPLATIQEQASGGEQDSQDHPRSNGPPPPAVPPPTAARDTSIALPLHLRFSAGPPPHPRFVAVLMDLEPEVNSDSDAPPPYHPARLQDAPPGLSS
ncbi:hypothetical protein PYCCODRAFT_1470793 [Trametes coccinea BRFM310]|uniref:Uncharacterized protein n=1 Tax=Trametes coccinea (strain BRFM310) TaxID=1353009 RepID=A0A1Y2ICG0_TRAC3|nr:hypothetical protein PYCCODRAFT_1470793 [Trametes coccinea BRFM310]